MESHIDLSAPEAYPADRAQDSRALRSRAGTWIRNAAAFAAGIAVTIAAHEYSPAVEPPKATFTEAAAVPNELGEGGECDFRPSDSVRGVFSHGMGSEEPTVGVAQSFEVDSVGDGTIVTAIYNTSDTWDIHATLTTSTPELGKEPLPVAIPKGECRQFKTPFSRDEENKGIVASLTAAAYPEDTPPTSDRLAMNSAETWRGFVSAHTPEVSPATGVFGWDKAPTLTKLSVAEAARQATKQPGF